MRIRRAGAVFLNLLALIVIVGLYSPVQIDVTCAARGTASTESVIKVEQGRAEAQAASEAVQRSADEKAPVYVQF